MRSNLLVPSTLITTLALAFALAGCGGPLKYMVRGSELSIASDANVVAAVDDTRKVTELTISATNLTPPDRLIPNGAHLVLWSRKGPEVAWVRAGALELDSDKRNGNAKFTISETAFDMLVSAEVDAAPASPSGKTVFSQRVEKK